MIIESLTADNFRKYAHLKIDDIPEKGLITVSGSNESGKTSIADALSFALFGRTFFTDENNARKLILWGEKAATVVLCFKRQDKRYELRRTVDKEGRIEAQLLEVEELDGIDKEVLLAETPEETADVLQGILGYGYEAFSDSFYLVQRELSTPHPNSDSLKDMVGISAYSKVSNDLQRANKRDAAELDIVRPKYESSYQALKDLGIDGTWLPDLIDARETLNTDDDENQLLVAQLAQSAKIYAEDRHLYEQTSRKHRWLEIFADIVLALLVGVLVLWAVLRFLPEWAKTVLFTPETMERFAPVYAWNEKWMLLVAAFIAWGFFLSLLYTWRTEDKGLIPLEKNATVFATALSVGQEHVSESLADQLPQRCYGLLSKKGDNAHHGAQRDAIAGNNIRAMRGGEVENDRLDDSVEGVRQQRMQELVDAVKYYEANPALPAEAAKLLRVQLKKRSKRNMLDQQILQGAIDVEIERTEVAADLRKKLAIHDEAIRNHTRHIKVQNTAIDLLRTSSKEFTEVFNRSITQASASILPHFTNGHYSNIRIDENLNVGVFSQEKNDFMDFDEISSGTQRQIMLALRIAMSEELAKQNDEEQQYIILDEPFAFFDMERTIETLEKLPKVSDIICQVWVVSQEFPSGTEPDKAIACTDAAKLIV